MLKTIPTSSGLLFASFLYRSDKHLPEDLKSLWSSQFGNFNEMVPKQNPLFTYYEKEMGSPLSRFLLISENSFPRDSLLQGKLTSMEWEAAHSHEGKRSLNVDIGFLSPENFILATTKNYSHRVYLAQDIFADLTFQFQGGSFKPLPWTYPDYLDEEKISFLTRERLRLLARPSA